MTDEPSPDPVTEETPHGQEFQPPAPDPAGGIPAAVNADDVPPPPVNPVESAAVPYRPVYCRVFNALLGGDDTFAEDRALAARLARITPTVPGTAYAVQHFLRRAVQQLVAEGTRSFLVLGSGSPTPGPVHEIAQDDNPSARIVYIDADPFAAAMYTEALRGNLNTSAIHADLRDIDGLLNHPEVHRQLDFTDPITVLFPDSLPFLTDHDHPADLTTHLARMLPTGSHLLLSHATADADARMHTAAQAITTATGVPYHCRSHAQVAALLDGFTVLPPGIVHPDDWRPDDPRGPDSIRHDGGAWAALARRR